MTSGMRNIKPKVSNRYLSGNEPSLFINKFIGLDLDTPYNNVQPGYFRQLKNLDLFKNDMRTRRGWGVMDTHINYQGVVTNGVIWDVGASELAVFCNYDVDNGAKTRFYWKNLTTASAFTPVYLLNAPSLDILELDTDVPPDLFVLNNRIYVFSVVGNYIIEYGVDTNPANVVTIRTMGLTAPACNNYDASASGSMTGDYCIGVELVYQVDGIDQVASTPNRYFNSSDQLFIVYGLVAKQMSITIDSTTLPSGGGLDDYWTQVRVYISRRLDRDTSDPANPIGPFGTDAELYPVAIIDKADLVTASYVITFDVNDDAIDTSEVWEYDRIELSPLPAGYCGTVHKDRIYVAGCLTADPTESKLFYSNFAGTKYSEQSNALQNIPVNAGDGKKIRKLLSLTNDLVVFKETSTFICQNGNVDLPPTIIDKSIGVSSHRLAQYIPKLGLVAFTSDNFDIKIFSDNLQWTNVYNKLEISRMIRAKARTYAANPNQVSMFYINGKLHISNGGGAIFDYVSEVLVLHVEQGLGWTTYEYPITTSQFMFTFDNNSRAGIITGAQVAQEIEIFDTYQDSPSTTPFDIPISIQTHMFQNSNGQDLLEMHKLLISASLDITPLTGTAYVNNITWQSISNTNFKPDPTELLSTQRSGLYELFLSKRPIYPWMYFVITSAGNISIDFIKWTGIINSDLALNYINRIKSPALPIILVQPSNVEVTL